MDALAVGSLSAIAYGVLFGFQDSISPGPLQTLIISESLSHGMRSSWRAAIVPTVSDPVALAVAIFFVSRASDAFLAAIAIFGAAILCRIAWSELTTTDKDFGFQTRPRLSFMTIWFTNIFNPNLWIFSFTINAIQINHYNKNFGLGVAALYFTTFLVVMCATNLTIAFIISRNRHAVNVKWRVAINRILSVFLLLVAFRFLYMGAGYLGFLSTSPDAGSTLSNLPFFF
ncbi:MAG: LysE family translocator [Thermoguttaceae bacterium]|jgi:threonine/homoserine/homoserine lactone efflux protein